ncbi:RdRp [Aedes alboannulatus toti-like virus 1]|uniref:RdRp n=1 Tax=Aedes alboannulatus toti-like virus 1 TaxID=2010265 RepID=UPI000B4F959B|nr:RdRp [Aedes alboannulatus toti-like virus 1]ASA47459.1 RdRp [Aedes alboannulatus toti-like virus 1]
MSHPHVCLLSTLRIVEEWYHMLWLHPATYNKWMQMNGGDYQLGNSPSCMSLWDEVDSEYKLIVKTRNSTSSIDFAAYRELVSGSSCIELVKCRHCNNGASVNIEWSNIKAKSDLNCLDLIWRYSSDADESKTNISASQIIWHCRKRKEFQRMFGMFIPMLGVTASNVTATAIAIHSLGNPSAEWIARLLIKKRICCLDPKGYSKVFKSISIAIRRSSHWPDGRKATLEEVAQSSGWELAIGRSSNTSDWIEERRKRISCKMHLRMPQNPNFDEESNEEYCKLLRVQLSALVRLLLIDREFTTSYEEFVKNRQSWVSSGSTGGHKIIVEGRLERVNKHVLFESLRTEEMVAWLDDEPRTEAVASEKFEMGKARAIYGTKPIDYTISSYVLNDIEPRLSVIPGIESGLNGMDIIASVANRKATAMQPRTECSMIDYADFNYQHTLQAQALVFDALADEFERIGAHPDKVRASRWTRDALLNQWCRFPLRSKPDKITQGMFSGCRGTNFLNTLLNEAYFLVAMNWVKTYLNLSPLYLFNIHQGDDVWISNESRLWAVGLFQSMQQSGFVFQASKQMFDVCRAEFLRVLYSDEGCVGYMARAIAALIIKPIQSSDVTGPAERAISLHGQICIISRRGFSPDSVGLLWRAMVPYGARVNLPRGGLTIPMSILYLHPSRGGLGLVPPGEMSDSKAAVKAVPTFEASSKALEEAVPCNMSRDWVVLVSERVQKEFDSKALLDMVHASNVTDSLRPIDKLWGLRALEDNLRKWKAGLVLPRVVCDKSIMDAFFSEAGFYPDLERAIEDLLSGKMTKKSQRRRGPASYINLAVSMSPFKSLPAAAVSMKGDWETIVRACISMCINDYIREVASYSVEELLKTVGVGVTRCLVEGQNVGLSNFEVFWHPIILSWVHDMAMERATLGLIVAGTQDVPQAKLYVQSEFDNAIRVLNKFKDMRELSKY